jgi:hypothetical protein
VSELQNIRGLMFDKGDISVIYSRYLANGEVCVACGE